MRLASLLVTGCSLSVVSGLADMLRVIAGTKHHRQPATTNQQLDSSGDHSLHLAQARNRRQPATGNQQLDSSGDHSLHLAQARTHRQPATGNQQLDSAKTESSCN